MPGFKDKVFKRKIFYLGGFDPRGARFYHALLGEQVAAHNASGAPALRIGPRRRVGTDTGWEMTDDAGTMHIDTVFLVWDDLVRRHWPKGAAALLGNCLVAYRYWLTRIDWGLARRVPRGTLITLLYPGATFVGLPVVITIAAAGVLALLLTPILAVLGGLALGGGLALILLRRIHSLWLLRFIIFNDQLARGRTSPALIERLERFVETIDRGLDAAIAEGVDEVLLLTHSNGSILVVPMMAQLLARRGGVMPAQFSLVTLGSCILLLGGRRDAAWFAALEDRVAAGDFHWLDIGSFTDGACIPGIDPFESRPRSRPAGLLQLSPRWFRYCDPATYRARRKDKYLTHFDYLRRLDRPSPLDYLGLTVSARPLAESIAAFQAENERAGPGSAHNG